MDYTTYSTVFVTAQIVGYHRWPEAPATTSYLTEDHRHLFGVKVELEVSDENRQVEYHALKRWLLDAGLAWVGTNEWNERLFSKMSCEMIAGRILHQLYVDWPGSRWYQVTVDEDGENGSTVTAEGA